MTAQDTKTQQTLAISSDGLQLLKIFAENANGNSRWADGDFAQIYGQDKPDIEQTIEELFSAKLIKSASQPIGRRKTDQYEITQEGRQVLSAQA